MKLMMASVNYRETPLDIRERLSVSDTDLPLRLNELNRQPGVLESVILSTCNRVEAYVVIDSEADYAVEYPNPAAWFINHLNESSEFPVITKHDDGAVLHLLRVASSLESMVVGESEIISQVAKALERARQEGVAGPILSSLFHSAVRTARRIRTETKLGKGIVSVASIALRRAEKELGSLKGKKVLLVGAGQIAAATVLYLQKSGAILHGVTNRTAQHAKDLIEERKLKTNAIEWFNLKNHFSKVDIIVVATGAPHAILRKNDFNKMYRWESKPLLVIDLAVPRNVEPAVAEVEGVILIDVDMLQSVAKEGMQTRLDASEKAEKLVDVEASRLYQRLERPMIDPALKQMAVNIKQHSDDQLSRLMKALNLSETDEKTRKILQHAFKHMASKIMHRAFSYLRRLGRTGSAATAMHLAHEMFGVEWDDIPQDDDDTYEEGNPHGGSCPHGEGHPHGEGSPHGGSHPHHESHPS